MVEKTALQILIAEAKHAIKHGQLLHMKKKETKGLYCVASLKSARIWKN